MILLRFFIAWYEYVQDIKEHREELLLRDFERDDEYFSDDDYYYKNDLYKFKFILL